MVVDKRTVSYNQQNVIAVSCPLRVYLLHTDPIQVTFLGLEFLVVNYKLIPKVWEHRR